MAETWISLPDPFENNVVHIMKELGCGDSDSFSESITVSRRGPSDEAAYRAAMPEAMRRAYSAVINYLRQVDCPDECPADPDLTTAGTAVYSYSRWDALLSLIPLSGVAGGHRCTATFTADVDVKCAKPS